MKSKLLPKILIALMCLVLALALISCSRRSPNDEYEGPIGGKPDPTQNKPGVEVMEQKVANEYVKNAVNNIDRTKVEDPEWLNIDCQITFVFNDYTTVPYTYTDYLITVQGNIHLEDNMQSNALIEIKNSYTGVLVFGFYYYNATAYMNISGKRYYMKELNLAYIGSMLATLIEENDLNIAYIMGSFLSGKPDFGDSETGSMIADYISLAIDFGLLYKKTFPRCHTATIKTMNT